MKKIIYQSVLIIPLLFFSFHIFSQELNNGSFEIKVQTANANKPNDSDQMNKCKWWKQAKSPDWFKNCAAHIYVEDLIGGNYVPVSGNTGCGYAGLAQYEMIQQKVGELNPGALYGLNLYVRPQETDSRIVYPNGDIPQLSAGVEEDALFTQIKIYISVEKLQYENENTCGCMDGTCNLESPNPNNAPPDKWVLANTVSLAGLSSDEWHKVEIPVMIPNNDWIYDWISIQSNGPYCDYILVDDIELCDIDCTSGACNGCIAEDGCLDIVATNHHTWITNGGDNIREPFQISGLGNVSHFNIEIRNYLSQIVRVIDYDHPVPIFQFDGKDNIGGELAEGTYNYTLTVNNNCDAEVITDQFTFVSEPSTFVEGNGSPISTPRVATYIPYPDKVDIVNDGCCYETVYLTSDNLMINPFGEQSFSISEDLTVIGKTIIVGNIEIPSGITLNLIGTESVQFVGESTSVSDLMKANPGSIVTVVMDPTACGKMFTSNGDNTTRPNSSVISSGKDSLLLEANNRSETDNKEESKKDFGLSVFPNPSTKGKFTIEIEGLEKNKEATIIEVMDMFGKRIFTKLFQGNNIIRLNLSDQSKGVYLLKISKGDQSQVEKLLYY